MIKTHTQQARSHNHSIDEPISYHRNIPKHSRDSIPTTIGLITRINPAIWNLKVISSNLVVEKDMSSPDWDHLQKSLKLATVDMSIRTACRALVKSELRLHVWCNESQAPNDDSWRSHIIQLVVEELMVDTLTFITYIYIYTYPSSSKGRRKLGLSSKTVLYFGRLFWYSLVFEGLSS